jgi:hypothetical protein
MLSPGRAFFIPSVPITDPVAAACARERCRKMFELTKAAFPDLKVPTPFVSVVSQQKELFRMPFVHAFVRVKPYDSNEDGPQNVFRDVLCLWDTGAETSMISTSMLRLEVRCGEEQGFASLCIQYVPAIIPSR